MNFTRRHKGLKDEEVDLLLLLEVAVWANVYMTVVAYELVSANELLETIINLRMQSKHSQTNVPRTSWSHR